MTDWLDAVAERKVLATTSDSLDEWNGEEYVLLLAAERNRLVAEVRRLRDELAGLYAWKRSVDEALNSGDGSYRP